MEGILFYNYIVSRGLFALVVAFFSFSYVFFVVVAVLFFFVFF